MSARALAWAWDQVPTSRPAKLVLLALADRADEEGVCWPSRRWLARKCKPMGIDAVTRALALLADEGLIVKEERQRRPDGTLSTWVIRLPVDQSAEMPTGQNRPLEPVGGNADAYTKNPKTSTDVEGQPAKSRARDTVFDALVERFGEAPKGRTARGAWGRSVADLRADGWDGVSPSVSELEHVYGKLYGDAAFTPTALAKHFTRLRHELVGKQERRAASVCPECSTGGGLHLADCPRAVVAA